MEAKVIEFCMFRKDRTITGSDMRKRKWCVSRKERFELFKRMETEMQAGKVFQGKRHDSFWFTLNN